MKRLLYIVVCLVFLLLSLSVSAFAGTSYNFYLFDESIALYGESFVFNDYESVYVYEGLLPDGQYTTYSSASFGSDFVEVISADGFYYPGDSFSGILSCNVYRNGLLEGTIDVEFVIEPFEDITVMGIDTISFGISPSDLPYLHLVQVENEESIGIDIINTELFGFFLVCGTLVGLSLLKGNRYV